VIEQITIEPGEIIQTEHGWTARCALCGRTETVTVGLKGPITTIHGARCSLVARGWQATGRGEMCGPCYEKLLIEIRYEQRLSRMSQGGERTR
jgi:hypothetical protein